jgi:hypothetical protein
VSGRDAALPPLGLADNDFEQRRYMTDIMLVSQRGWWKPLALQARIVSVTVRALLARAFGVFCWAREQRWR